MNAVYKVLEAQVQMGLAPWPKRTWIRLLDFWGLKILELFLGIGFKRDCILITTRSYIPEHVREGGGYQVRFRVSKQWRSSYDPAVMTLARNAVSFTFTLMVCAPGIDLEIGLG